MTGVGIDFPPRDRAIREESAGSLIRSSGLQCARILRKWVHDPVTLAQSLLYPAIMVLLFWLVLDRAVTDSSGTPSAFGMVPMVALIGAMSGASVSGLGLRRERDAGQLAKMWALPVHRASAMVGRLAAEAVRVLVTVVFILLIGTSIGFRVQSGILGVLAILGISVGFGLSFSVMVTALALVSRSARIVEWTGIGTNLAMFFNSGFVPVDSYPAWLRPIVQSQPLSCAVEAIRGAAAGTPATGALWATLAWSVGLLAVFAHPAVRGYRLASTR